MKPKGTFSVTVLKDGSIKVVTDQFSPEIHDQADRLLELLQDAMGGVEADVVQVKAHKHHHHNGEQHHHH